MSTSSRILRAAWVPLAIGLVSLPVAEIAFRALGVRVAATMSGIYEPFGDGSFKMRPHAHAFMNWYSGPFSVYSDALGLRVASPSSAEQPADCDVLVIGESQAFGQGVDFDDSMVGSFARAARASGICVRNAAIGAHGLRNQIELVRWLVEKQGLRPKVVLVVLTSRNISYPDFYMRAFVHDGSLYDGPPGRWQLARSWLSSRSAAWVLFRNAFRGNAYGKTVVTEFARIYDVSLHGPRLAALRGDLDSLEQVLTPVQAKLALTYAPLAAEINASGWMGSAAAPGQVLSAEEPSKLAGEVAAAYQTPLADLTPVVRAAAARGEPLTLRGDDHYAPALSRACGEKIFSAINWNLLTRKGEAHDIR